jgi:ParB-like chromosome segregation protein Spo0J
MTMTTKTKSWRDEIKVHPAADMFPMMSADELKALAEDIRVQGLVHRPVVQRSPNGGFVLIDGRNRLDALELLGLKYEQIRRDFPFWVREDVDDDEFAYEYIISANIHRRHLTAEQKRELIAKLVKAQPGKSNRQIAKQTKADHKTVGAVRDKLEARGEIPNVSSVEDTKGRKQQAHKPAKKKRHDVDDYLAEKKARMAANAAEASTMVPDQTDLEDCIAERTGNGRPGIAVTLDSGPIEAADRLRHVPCEKWRELMLARRRFCEIKLSYDCRCLVEFINDAEAMYSELGFASPDDMIRDGYGLKPAEIAIAIDWLGLKPPKEPICLEKAVEIIKRMIPRLTADELREFMNRRDAVTI